MMPGHDYVSRDHGIRAAVPRDYQVFAQLDYGADGQQTTARTALRLDCTPMTGMMDRRGQESWQRNPRLVVSKLDAVLDRPASDSFGWVEPSIF